MKVSFILFSLICLSHLLYGQSWSPHPVKVIDTLTMEGYIFGVTNKDSSNMDKNIDYFFLTKNEMKNLNSKSYKDLSSIEKNRDSVFVMKGTGKLFIINAYYLKNTPVTEEDSNYVLPSPSIRHHQYSDGKAYISYEKVNVQCLHLKLNAQDLSRLVDFNQYKFKNFPISIFIINKIEVVGNVTN